MAYTALFVSLVALVLVVAYIQYNERRERIKRDARETYQESIRHQLQAVRGLMNCILHTETDGEEEAYGDNDKQNVAEPQKR